MVIKKVEDEIVKKIIALEEDRTNSTGLTKYLPKFNFMKKFLILYYLLLIPNWAQTVTYFNDGNNKIEGYLSMPKDKSQTAPGIILIHEWWGLNNDIREKADYFASQGYAALAVDLYNGKSTTKAVEARKLAGDVRKNMDKAFTNLNGALDYLKKQPRVNSQKLASIGWCFGGGWSYQVAKNNLGVKASVIYYGRFNPKDDFKKMRANIIGHFAKEDRGISLDNVKEFEAVLKTQKGKHKIYIYPNTTHGFASRPSDNPNFDKIASDLALKRTLTFLEESLN